MLVRTRKIKRTWKSIPTGYCLGILTEIPPIDMNALYLLEESLQAFFECSRSI